MRARLYVLLRRGIVSRKISFNGEVSFRNLESSCLATIVWFLEANFHILPVFALQLNSISSYTGTCACTRPNNKGHILYVSLHGIRDKALKVVSALLSSLRVVCELNNKDARVHQLNLKGAFIVAR